MINFLFNKERCCHRELYYSFPPSGVFPTLEWRGTQSLHWSLYICENSLCSPRSPSVLCIKSTRLSMWLLCELDLMETLLCLSFSCSLKSLWRQDLQSHMETSTVRWVCVCVVYGIGRARVFFIISLSSVLLFLSPGSIIFWVKRPTRETSRPSAAESSSSRWPELNHDKCQRVQENWGKNWDVFVCFSCPFWWRRSPRCRWRFSLCGSVWRTASRPTSPPPSPTRSCCCCRVRWSSCRRRTTGVRPLAQLHHGAQND